MAAYDCYYPRFWDVSLAFGRRFSFLVVFGLRKTLNIIRRPHPSFPPPPPPIPPALLANQIRFHFDFHFQLGSKFRPWDWLSALRRHHLIPH